MEGPEFCQTACKGKEKELTYSDPFLDVMSSAGRPDALFLNGEPDRRNGTAACFFVPSSPPRDMIAASLFTYVLWL
jgi:hypothetical protein